MTPETIVLLILGAALTVYVVLGGADFGAGVWEFNTALRLCERERNLLYKAIGPVWETNHVWLIFVIVLLFGAFPKGFAAINQALFVPLSLGLVGIVFRGAAYAFRSPLKAEPDRQRPWIILFAAASVFAPLFLGAAVGAAASGQLSFDQQGQFVGNPFSEWIHPFSIFVGAFTVGICAYSSATYMILEAYREGMADLVLVWRRRALVTGCGMGLLAAGGLVFVWQTNDLLWSGFLHRAWPIVVLSAASGVGSLWSIYRFRHLPSVLLTSLTSATVVIAWLVAQYPYLLPPAWKLLDVASPPNVLWLIIGTSLVGMLFLLPAIGLLFKIFKMESIDANAPSNR